jgi:GNAT superfamily N-acetyltransferase
MECLQPEFARARFEDFEAIATLFAALHCYNASLDEKFALAMNWQTVLHDHFVRTYASDDALWLLAWQDKQPVGLLVLECHCDSSLFQHRHWVELVALYVVPSHRQRGLARQLLVEAQAWTARHGLDRLQLYVTTSNEQARAFYRRCGWQPVQEIWRTAVELHSSPTPHSARSDDLETRSGKEFYL